MVFSAVTSLAMRRMEAVGEAVWTKRVAAAYGGMLREMKRVAEETRGEYDDGGANSEAAAPSVPPPLAPAAIGRALFARAVSADNADDVAGGNGGGGGETKDEGPPPPHPSAPSAAARPVKTLPRPAYQGDKLALFKVCGLSVSVCAGKYADVKKARDLIARGINIDEQNKGFKRTALIWATITNCLEIVQELIRAGAALDLQDKNGYTALMEAVMNKHPEIVQELIRAGAALDVQDNYGQTAFFHYQRQLWDGRDKDTSSGAIAAMLLEAGARCPGYKRSGVFNSTCKICRKSKKGHSLQ